MFKAWAIQNMLLTKDDAHNQSQDMRRSNTTEKQHIFKVNLPANLLSKQVV